MDVVIIRPVEIAALANAVVSDLERPVNPDPVALGLRERPRRRVLDVLQEDGLVRGTARSTSSAIRWSRRRGRVRGGRGRACGGRGRACGGRGRARGGRGRPTGRRRSAVWNALMACGAIDDGVVRG